MKAPAKSELYRKLPSVDELLHSASISQLIGIFGSFSVTAAVRSSLAELRRGIDAGDVEDMEVEATLTELAARVRKRVERSSQYSLREVINATGVILHTNLGRAPLSSRALDHIIETAGGYLNLEFDLATGERGQRDVHADELFRRILNDPGRSISGESTLRQVSTIVVNNNAAAVLLALNTLAEGAEVIVSRGELVEIGGSFRVPEIMEKSHAILREVGTTNRTSLADYESAITDRTKLLLRVHRSNFEITGFTHQPQLKELVDLAKKHKVPLMEDLGSGCIFDLSSVGIKSEPGVLGSLDAGVDVVTYSGDKLLGGPQSGILSGTPELVSRMRKNSLYRALRVDKLTYAAMEAGLVAYVKRDYDSIPALRMIRLTKDEISTRAQEIVKQGRSTPIELDLIDGESVIGGGSAPSAVLPTRLITITCADFRPDELLERLRQSRLPVIARVQHDRVLLDLRTVFPEQDSSLVVAIKGLVSRN